MAIDYRKKIVDTATKYVGTTEPTGDDKFIIAYNKWAGSNFDKNSTPWCAIFVTYCARMAGVPINIVPTFASCSVAMGWFNTRGRYHSRESGYVPKAGDIMFFDWKPGTGVDHVGLVIGVTNGKVNTIEGNTRNNGKGAYGVFKKSYNLTSELIMGYGDPDYTGEATTTVANPTNLSGLVKGTYIKKFQEWMVATYPNCGISKSDITGTFDAASKKAAVRCWKAQMNTSYKAKLINTCIFDVAASAACIKRPLNQNSKAKNLVYILQGMLYAHGYDPKGFDGNFGPGCAAAVASFKKARKLGTNSTVDRNTWESLFTKW